MFSSLKILFVVALAMVITAGCATPGKRVACAERDWYETGRRDGMQGRPVTRLDQFKVACEGSVYSDWETMFVNGHNAGLVEYCAPDNAFELGRMGLAYQYVCPSTVEEKFLAGYRRGQKARDLESANQRLGVKIENVVAELDGAADGYERRLLSSELSQLRSERARVERQLNRISN